MPFTNLKMTISIPSKTWIVGALIAACSVAGFAVGQDASLGQEGVAAPHIQLIEELERENSDLRLKCEELEAKYKSISSSVGVLAEREALTKARLEEVLENFAKANVRLELLSGALEQDGQGFEEQLANAANDYRLVEEQKNQIAHALLNLSDAVEGFVATATSSDEAAKSVVEKSIKDGEVALGLILQEDHFEEKSIVEAQVISVNKDYNLALVDVGSRHGLRVGTPVSFHRRDRTIGTALVIDVRESIAGAVFIDLTDPNDQIIVGDSMRIDPEGV